jgi:hypothetical protein
MPTQLKPSGTCTYSLPDSEPGTVSSNTKGYYVTSTNTFYCSDPLHAENSTPEAHGHPGLRAAWTALASDSKWTPAQQSDIEKSAYRNITQPVKIGRKTRLPSVLPPTMPTCVMNLLSRNSRRVTTDQARINGLWMAVHLRSDRTLQDRPIPATVTCKHPPPTATE